MKKLYFFVFGILLCTIVQAQINKGAIMIGGNVGYSEQSGKSSGALVTTKMESWNVNPSFGKAIKDNLVLGLDINYGHSHYDNGDPSYDNGTNNYKAGVFLRRYKPIGNNFYLFIQSMFSVSYTHGTASYQNGNNIPYTHDDNKEFGLAFQIYPGISYAINRKWQLETGLPNFLSAAYNHSKDVVSNTGQPDQSSSGHSFQISSSLTGSNQFTVGVRYFIGG
jgi:hypothetical protein